MERFYDIMDCVTDGLLLIEANFYLLTTEEGGRKSPIKTGYRPNHNFDGLENNFFYIGKVDFEGEWLYLGENRKVTVSFFDARGLREKLTIGREWRIQEGVHLVGKGTITKLIFSS